MLYSVVVSSRAAFSSYSSGAMNREEPLRRPLSLKAGLRRYRSISQTMASSRSKSISTLPSWKSDATMPSSAMAACRSNTISSMRRDFSSGSSRTRSRAERSGTASRQAKMAAYPSPAGPQAISFVKAGCSLSYRGMALCSA